ncbi:MAG: RluA family pseudouridine synthase [Bacilli bacterium]|nr:RluA family pseudouridine synthase [Bacilli bacterium]
MIKMNLIVTEEGERLDKYLANNTDYTRSIIAKMLDENYIDVNGKVEKASYKVRLNDSINIKEGYVSVPDIEPVKMDIDIVYEDDDLIIVNKPSGLVVHPGSGNYNNTLVNGLLDYTNNLSDLNGEARPGIVHRIDKDTSGLILIAKNNKTHALLTDYFKDHKNIKREYIALLCGVFPHETATIDAPIGRDPKDRKKMAVTADNSKEAITHLKVLKRYKEYTLVSCILETGRTHQIRVHMNYIGYPIYNDPVYNTKHATEFGQFLHSAKMDFIHPITKKEMHFEAPLPEYFQNFIDNLEEQK